MVCFIEINVLQWWFFTGILQAVTRSKEPGPLWTCTAGFRVTMPRHHGIGASSVVPASPRVSPEPEQVCRLSRNLLLPFGGLCRTRSPPGGSNADTASPSLRFVLRHVCWQKDYLGQIPHSGIPNTSLHDFIELSHFAK